jgi:hypothetical protein
MKTAWNTGRLYRADGQPMLATMNEARTEIRFKDDARMISGVIDCSAWGDLIDNEEQLQRATMRAYDDGQYRNI